MSGARPTLPMPRNARSGAVDQAREKDISLVISLVGSTGFANPHVFIDPGQRYDWSFLGTGHLHCLVATRRGIDSMEAVRAAWSVCQPIKAYPTLIDIEQQEVSFITDGYELWQVRKGTGLWRQYFNAS